MISGKIYKANGTNYFDCYPVGCSGYSNDLVKGNKYEHSSSGHYSEFTWGYDGAGSRLLAVAILACAMDMDPADPDPVEWHNHPQRKRILKLYKAFSTEVVANFGDEWSMTQDEVLDWVKKKEAQ